MTSPPPSSHWQVRILWWEPSGVGNLVEAGAWIPLTEAPTAEAAIETCRAWRSVPAGAHVISVKVRRWQAGENTP